MKGKISRTLLFCKVGVGRAFVSTEEGAEANTLPDGYDSFYLHDPKSAHNHEEYYHEYYIKKEQNLLPQYLVNFSYDPADEEKALQVPQCENCESEDATVYCAADKANLCGTCDEKLHSSKIAAKHERSPIGRGTGCDAFGNCRHHVDEGVKYYCNQCHVPVCIVCKMVGNHSSGEANKHQLISVSDAYQAVLGEAKEVCVLF
jgi:hypothetical protein